MIYGGFYGSNKYYWLKTFLSIMTSKITRREFLKIGSLAAMGIGLPVYPPGGNPYLSTPALRMGRTTRSLNYYEHPSYASGELGYYNTDAVINIFKEKMGDARVDECPIWVKSEDGWLNSTFIQPVRNVKNQPVMNIPAGGMLAEVTVPFTQSWSMDNDRRKRAYRFYYSSTHWVHNAYPTSDGNIWYRILDDGNKGSFLVMAEDLRPITEKEISPISPDVLNKHIEVDLTGQRLKAFENEKPVFSARIASGYFEGDTPMGEFTVERKNPSRHMAARTETSEFDLPGVPWVCFISWTGVSIHGTYWHNNYGTPQSHGCINLTPEAAKWIYRWTDPFVPVEDNYEESENGTKVVIY